VARIEVVQIRERDLDTRGLFALVSQAVTITRGTSTRIVVNDRLDVALAAGADGVHLRADSMAPAVVRSLVPPGFLVGRSVHSVEEAAEVEASVDYLIAGTVWQSASKPQAHPLLGLTSLAAIAAAVRVPVLAIGGCTVALAGDAARAGARGLAGIGLFMSGSGAVSGCRVVPLEQAAASIRAGFDIT
jgi:thiamine-phosphate diphosphorylase